METEAVLCKENWHFYRFHNWHTVIEPTLLRILLYPANITSYSATIASLFLIFAILAWKMSSDMTYYYSGVVLWAIAEMTCGILIFCAPVVPRFCQDLKLDAWFSELLASSLSFAGRTSWSSTMSQNREERRSRSVSRDDRETDETGSIRMRVYGSPRPTDRQYGIFVTTDIVVDTVQNKPAAGAGDSDEQFQYSWAAKASGAAAVDHEYDVRNHN
ncbi:hypothetical protein F5B22DRAFT_439078 [Xylaria bambusicola]|uniref:uncharacterized protein n=1 Tax=Xylaria bambusicola TaxID=326684 RepID=UPI002007FC6A|nr:uncharacterized protein F5B22DRAFT_439078 [Xylaria bambusicola]KAI0506655.1 hypothetical protein F5B22DRAFT_439078 [Xylaria bambusicola]